MSTFLIFQIELSIYLSLDSSVYCEREIIGCSTENKQSILYGSVFVNSTSSILNYDEVTSNN